MVDHPYPWYNSIPFVVGRGAVLWGELHPEEGLCEGLLIQAFPCGWWGRCLGHLVVLSLQGLCSLQSCADGGQMSWRVGRIAPVEVVTRQVVAVLLYGDCGCDDVLSCPSLWVVVQGWRMKVW